MGTGGEEPAKIVIILVLVRCRWYSYSYTDTYSPPDVAVYVVLHITPSCIPDTHHIQHTKEGSGVCIDYICSYSRVERCRPSCVAWVTGRCGHMPQAHVIIREVFTFLKASITPTCHPSIILCLSPVPPHCPLRGGWGGARTHLLLALSY